MIFCPPSPLDGRKHRENKESNPWNKILLKIVSMSGLHLSVSIVCPQSKFSVCDSCVCGRRFLKISLFCFFAKPCFCISCGFVWRWCICDNIGLRWRISWSESAANAAGSGNSESASSFDSWFETDSFLVVIVFSFDAFFPWFAAEFFGGVSATDSFLVETVSSENSVSLDAKSFVSRVYNIILMIVISRISWKEAQ